MAMPPLPKGAVVVGEEETPPLPAGATVVEEKPPEEKGFFDRFMETFHPAQSMLEESILPMVAPPGGYAAPADLRALAGEVKTPPTAQQVVGSYMEQKAAEQAQRRAQMEGEPKKPLPGVFDTLGALKDYAVKDPGGFSGAFASALIADPALLMLPEFIPAKVVNAVAKTSKAGAAALKVADAATQASAVAAGESAARQLRETGTIDMELLRNDVKNAAGVAATVRGAGMAIAPGVMLKPGSTEASQKLVKEAAQEGYAVPMEHLSTFGAAIDKFFRRPQTDKNSKLFVKEVTDPTGTPVTELNPDNMAKINSNLSQEVQSVLSGTSLRIPPSYEPLLREFLKYKKGSVDLTLESIKNGIPIRGEDWHEIRSILGQQRNSAYGSNPSLANDIGDIMNGWDTIANRQLPTRVRVAFNKWKSKYVAYSDLFDAVSANPTSFNNFQLGKLDPQDLANAIRSRRPKEAVQRRTQREQTAAATRAAALDLTKAGEPKSLSSAFPLLDPAIRSVLAVPAKLSQLYMYSPLGQRTMIGGPGGGITMGRVPRLAGEIPNLELPPPQQEGEGYAGGGLIEKGNIDTSNLPVVRNPDGTVSTVSTIGVGIDGGREVVIPTIINGRRVSDEEAREHFFKTGQHFGIFDSVKAANEFAQKLHEQEAQRVVKKADGGLMLPADRSSNFRAPGEKPDETLSRFSESFLRSLPEAGMTSLRGSADLASLIAKYIISSPAKKAEMLATVPALASAVAETAKTEIPKIPARVAAATPEDYGKFAAQYTADTMLDPMRLGKTRIMTNVVKPKGGTVLPGEVDKYIDKAKTQAAEGRSGLRLEKSAPDVPTIPQEINDFWEKKARNYFLKSFGSEEDPLRDALFSGQIFKGDRADLIYRDYAMKAAKQGDRQALEDLMKRYDEATRVRAYQFVPEGTETDWNSADRLRQSEANKIPMIHISGRQILPSQELLNINATVGTQNKILEQGFAPDELQNALKSMRDVSGSSPVEPHIARAIESGETVYTMKPDTSYQNDFLDPAQINNYLKTKTPEEIKNMTFSQAVAEASQMAKPAILEKRVMRQIQEGKAVDRSYFDANTTPVFNYEDGSNWVKLNNQEAMKYECAYIGHCGRVTGGNERIDTGDIHVFSLRDARGRPTTTVELEPVRSRSFLSSLRGEEEPAGWRVNQLSGEGRKTGNATPNATAPQIINLLDSIPNIKEVKYTNAVGEKIPNDVARWAQEKGVKLIGAPTRVLGEVDELARGGAVYSPAEQLLLNRYASR